MSPWRTDSDCFILQAGKPEQLSPYWESLSLYITAQAGLELTTLPQPPSTGIMACTTKPYIA